MSEPYNNIEIIDIKKQSRKQFFLNYAFTNKYIYE